MCLPPQNCTDDAGSCGQQRSPHLAALSLHVSALDDTCGHMPGDASGAAATLCAPVVVGTGRYSAQGGGTPASHCQSARSCLESGESRWQTPSGGSAWAKEMKAAVIQTASEAPTTAVRMPVAAPAVELALGDESQGHGFTCGDARAMLVASPASARTPGVEESKAGSAGSDSDGCAASEPADATAGVHPRVAALRAECTADEWAKTTDVWPGTSRARPLGSGRRRRVWRDVVAGGR